jgi:multicomponent Na+:H+ antiporter subunit D
MPVTSATSLVASFSIAGIPPFCGFWSKLMIVLAAFQANNIVGGVVCVLVAMVTLASFLKVQKYAFMRKLDQAAGVIKEVPFSMKFSMVVLAMLCILAGIFFVPLVDIIFKPAAAVLLEGTNYAKSILGV